MQDQDTLQRASKCIAYLERTLLNWAHLSRSTAVTMAGDTFKSMIQRRDRGLSAELVWRCLRERPRGSTPTVIVMSPTTCAGCKDDGPVTITDDWTPLVFHTSSLDAEVERAIVRMVEAGRVSLHTVPAKAYVDDPQVLVRLAAERVVHHSVYMCTVLLIQRTWSDPVDNRNANAAIADQIRAAVQALLESNGSTDAATQAREFPIVTPARIDLVRDAARTNLIVFEAHRMGTQQHRHWQQWAEPLIKQDVLKRIELVAAADIASTRPGFVTAHEWLWQAPIRRPRFVNLPADLARLRDLAMHLLEQRVPERQRLVCHDPALAKTLLSSARQSVTRGRYFVVTRLAYTSEYYEDRRFLSDNAQFCLLGVRLCTLLGNDEFAEHMEADYAMHAKTPRVVVVRYNTVDKFTLRDWVSFLIALPPRTVVVLTYNVGPCTLPTHIESAKAGPTPHFAAMT